MQPIPSLHYYRDLPHHRRRHLSPRNDDVHLHGCAPRLSFPKDSMPYYHYYFFSQRWRSVLFFRCSVLVHYHYHHRRVLGSDLLLLRAPLGLEMRRCCSGLPLPRIWAVMPCCYSFGVLAYWSVILCSYYEASRDVPTMVMISCCITSCFACCGCEGSVCWRTDDTESWRYI